MNDILDIHKTCCHSGQTADTRQLSKPFSPSVMGGMWTIGFTFAALYCVCVCAAMKRLDEGVKRRVQKLYCSSSVWSKPPKNIEDGIEPTRLPPRTDACTTVLRS